MISIARILGAPVTVPAGKQARSASYEVSSGLRRPTTWETRGRTGGEFSHPPSHAPPGLGVAAGAAGAGDRVIFDDAVLDPHEHLGRGTDDVGTAHRQVVHVRRRVDRAQRAIDGERVG